MSVENSKGRYPSAHETLQPIEQLLIASANMIDQNGKPRAGKNNTFIDAEWDNDQLGSRFSLQMQSSQTPWPHATFFLEVYDQFSHADAKEFYRYDSLLKRVSVCDENWRSTKIPKSQSSDTIPQLLEYLSFDSNLSSEQNQDFIELMAHNQVRDPRVAAKLRRFAAGVLKGLAKI